MYLCSTMEQKCYIVSKRSIAADNAPWTTSAGQNGTAMVELSTDRIDFMTGEVNGTVVLPGPLLKPFLVNNFAGDLITGRRKTRFLAEWAAGNRVLPVSNRLSILDSGCRASLTWVAQFSPV